MSGFAEIAPEPDPAVRGLIRLSGGHEEAAGQRRLRHRLQCDGPRIRLEPPALGCMVDGDAPLDRCVAEVVGEERQHGIGRGLDLMLVVRGPGDLLDVDAGRSRHVQLQHDGTGLARTILELSHRRFQRQFRCVTGSQQDEDRGRLEPFRDL